MVSERALCRYCGLSEPVVHCGLNRSGTQQLWCKECRKAWIPQARSRALSDEEEALIVAALGERLSQRAIARTFKVARTTLRTLAQKSRTSASEFQRHALARDPRRCSGDRRTGDPLSLQAALLVSVLVSVGCDLASHASGDWLLDWRPFFPEFVAVLVFSAHCLS
jgi:transposase-like protein